MLVCTLIFSSCTFSQIPLANSKWTAHTEIPSSWDIELDFQNDTLNKSFIFSQYGDSFPGRSGRMVSY
jgi:hypothetical protein